MIHPKFQNQYNWNGMNNVYLKITRIRSFKEYVSRETGDYKRDIRIFDGLQTMISKVFLDPGIGFFHDSCSQ